MTRPTVTVCETCAITFAVGPVGRMPRFCSDRCRKAQYARPCIDCGAAMNGSNGGGPNAPERCSVCNGRYQGARNRIWTREKIIKAILAWADLHGEPPAVPDWNPHHARVILHDDARASRCERGDWPRQQTVVDAFGSWNAGIAAAGFVPRTPGGGNGNGGRRREQRKAAA